MPTAKPTAKPTATPAPVAVALEASGFTFSPGSLTVPADAPFTIAFHNADPSIPHNVVIRSAGGAQLFSGKIITGDATITYDVESLSAGDYGLACIVHPTMSGSLTVR